LLCVFVCLDVHPDTITRTNPQTGGTAVVNHSIRFDAERCCFVFGGREFRTLKDFVDDPDYRAKLSLPLPKTMAEHVKPSKYLEEASLTDDLTSLSLGDS
jgi:hypothetical protein